jgi:hypothetical protein
MERQQREAAPIDLDVQPVDRVVSGQDVVDERHVPLDQRLDREADFFLGETAHLEQARLERVELLVKMRGSAFHSIQM